MAQHCEVSALTQGAVMNECGCSSDMGVPGWPAIAEEMMVPLAELVALEAIEDRDERLAALDAFLGDTAEALSAMPQLRITDDQAHRLRMGNPIILRGRDAPVAEPEAVALAGGKLIAIGEIAGGEFHPRRVFA